MEVKLPKIKSGEIILDNILSKVLVEFFVKGAKELEANESRNSLAGLCLL